MTAGTAQLHYINSAPLHHNPIAVRAEGGQHNALRHHQHKACSDICSWLLRIALEHPRGGTIKYETDVHIDSTAPAIGNRLRFLRLGFGIA